VTGKGKQSSCSGDPEKGDPSKGCVDTGKS
jgi:hypothetical protein